MARKLQGKVALVTGAARGIGRAIALRLARDGAAVVVNDVRGIAEAEAVVSEIERAGGRACAVQADVSNVAQVERLFDATISHFGKLDILVNNAGIIVYKALNRHDRRGLRPDHGRERQGDVLCLPAGRAADG